MLTEGVGRADKLERLLDVTIDLVLCYSYICLVRYFVGVESLNEMRQAVPDDVRYWLQEIRPRKQKLFLTRTISRKADVPHY